jgi:PilZ domain
MGTMEERRSKSRQLTCIPASFESKREHQDLALISDASITGARLYTRVELLLHEPVTLELYLGPGSGAPRKVEARVVRVERCSLTESEVWPWEIGVEFTQPIAEYEKEIEELCRRQEATGLLKR